MKLTEHQKKEIKSLIGYFEGLPKSSIYQGAGGTYDYHTEEELKKSFKKDTKECGVCFGVHLSYIYGIVNKDRAAYKKYNYHFMDGRDEFLIRMGIDTLKKQEELYAFMEKCGAKHFKMFPFGEEEWDFHPAQVLKNMLEKGA